MKSDEYNYMVLSVITALTITILILSSGQSIFVLSPYVSAQEHESIMSMSSNNANMMSIQEHSFFESLSDSDGKDNITSSISVFKPVIDAFNSYVQVEIIDAITTAQQSVGNNSTTLIAYIHPEGQFIVYNVFVVDSDGKFYRVIVDPGNGDLIDSEQISFIQMMAMFHGSGMMGHSGSGGMTN